MKPISTEIKNEIKKAGRVLKNRLNWWVDIYDEHPFDDDNLYSIKYSTYGGLLKSTMRMLEFETKEEIPLGAKVATVVELKYYGMTPWVPFTTGIFIVYNVEKREETGNYFYTCYDYMLYAMKDYEAMNITYPITIRDYINAIATHLGLTFKNASETFANYDKQIPQELYLDTNGKSLGFTFRDVLDDLAEATGSTIYINYGNNVGKLELKYPYETNDTIDGDFLRNTNVKFSEKFGPINSIVLSRSGESDNVFLQDEDSIEENGLCEIKIVDNQIMNDNNRSDYLAELLEVLDGLEYYINDISSTGVLYYELYDKFNVQIGDVSYPCLLLNDETDLTNGLEEHIYTENPEQSETDYKHASKTDRQINQVYIIAKKNEGEIEAVVSSVNTIDQRENNNYQEIINKFNGYATNDDVISIVNSVVQVQTDTYTKTEINTKLIDGSVEKVMTTSGTFDSEGLKIEKTDAPTNSLLNEKGLGIYDATGYSSEELLFAGYDETLNETIVRTKNINVSKYLTIGTHSRIEDYEDGAGVFYI